MSEKQDTFIGVTPTDIPADIKFNAKIDGWGLERIEGRSSSTVVYTITIIASNGSSWCLRRRYSEFRDNYLTMKHHYKKSKAAKFAFPGKTIFKTVSSANDRKELLQRYLNDLLDCHPPPVEVQYFLRITRKVLGLDNLGADNERPFVSPIKLQHVQRNNGDTVDVIDNHTIQSLERIYQEELSQAAETLNAEDNEKEDADDESMSSRSGRANQNPNANMIGTHLLHDKHMASNLPSAQLYHKDDEDMFGSPSTPGGPGSVAPSSHIEDLYDSDDSAETNFNDEHGPSFTNSKSRPLTPLEKKLAHLKHRTKSVHSLKSFRPYSMARYLSLHEEEDQHHIDEELVKLTPKAMVVMLCYASVLVLIKCVIDISMMIVKDPTWLTLGHRCIEYLTNTEWKVQLFALLSYLYNLWTHHDDWWTIIGKTTVFWVVFISVIHRIIGWALGEWLFTLLGTPKGAFNFRFQNIILRLGLVFNDNNEIIVNDFIWHNPPKFKDSPYFAKVSQLRLRFCLYSLIQSLRYPRAVPVHIHSIEIDGLELFIEKGPRQRDGLNLWACLGAENEEEAENVKGNILLKLVKVGFGLAGGVAGMGAAAVLGISSAAVSGVTDIASAGYTASKIVGETVMEYNPLTMTYHLVTGNTSTKQKKNKSNKGPNSIKQSEEETESDSDSECSSGSSYSSSDSDSDVDSDDDEYDITYNTRDSADLGGPSPSPSLRKLKNLDTVERRIRQERRELRDGAKLQRRIRRQQRVEATKKEKGEDLEPLDWNHWGIPLKLECDRITCRDLKFYVKDYLAAKHTEFTHQTAIEIPLLEMHSKELTDHNPKSRSIRDPVWFDDLIWKLISRLITDLLKRNLHNLLGTVAGSGFNQAKNGMIDGARMGMQATVQGIYNYNPKEMASAAVRGLHWVRNIGAPKLTRSPSVQDFQFSFLRVFIHQVRGLKIIKKDGSQEDFNSTVMMKVELRNQPGQDPKIYQQKTSACYPHTERDDEDRILYNFVEIHELENLTTLNAELYVRVFQSSVIRDITLGEVTLPLRDDTNPSLIEMVLTDSPEKRAKNKDQLAQSVKETGKSIYESTNVTFLPGIHEEKREWYLLYAKNGDEIVGEVNLGLGLFNRASLKRWEDDLQAVKEAKLRSLVQAESARVQQFDAENSPRSHRHSIHGHHHHADDVRVKGLELESGKA